MIIENGTIRIITKQGGGTLNGKPVKVTETESDPIPANISETTHRAYDTGSETWVTQQGYRILVAIDTQVTYPGRIAVFNSRSELIGKFDIQSAQPLDFVEVIQITI